MLVLHLNKQKLVERLIDIIVYCQLHDMRDAIDKDYVHQRSLGAYKDIQISTRCFYDKYLVIRPQIKKELAK